MGDIVKPVGRRGRSTRAKGSCARRAQGSNLGDGDRRKGDQERPHIRTVKGVCRGEPGDLSFWLMAPFLRAEGADERMWTAGEHADCRWDDNHYNGMKV